MIFLLGFLGLILMIFFKDPVTGRFEVVSHYYGANRSLVPVPGKREFFYIFFKLFDCFFDIF